MFSIANALSLSYSALVFSFVLFVLWLAFDSHYTLPNHDDWRVLDQFFATPLLQWLVKDQVGHRVPVTLALIYSDYRFFGGHMHLPVFASVLWVGVGAVLLVRVLGKALTRGDLLARSAASFAIFLWAWSASRHDLVWGLNQGTLLAALLALASLVCLAKAIGAMKTGASPSPWLLVGAPLAAAGATFSSGVGFASWAGLVSSGLVLRLPMKWLIGYSVSALVVLVIYLTGIEIPGRELQDAYTWRLMSAPGALLVSTIAYVGAPAVTLLPHSPPIEPFRFALVAGGLGVAGYLLLIVGFIRRSGPTTGAQAIAVGLPCAALAAGFMVALNRVGWSESALFLRYSTWSTLFWVGIAVGIGSLRGDREPRNDWRSLVGCVSIVLLTAALLPHLWQKHRDQQNRSVQLNYVSTMHLLGIRWDDLAGTTLIPEPERAYRVVARLRADGRSMFAETRARLPGRPLAESLALTGHDRCEGQVSWTQPTPARDGMVLRVAGWARDLARGGEPEQIVIADRDGIVRGLGVFATSESNLRGVRLPARNHAWAGFIQGPRRAGPYSVYAVLDDGTSACDLRVGPRAIVWMRQGEVPERARSARPGSATKGPSPNPR